MKECLQFCIKERLMGKDKSIFLVYDLQAFHKMINEIPINEIMLFQELQAKHEKVDFSDVENDEKLLAMANREILKIKGQKNGR